MALPELIQEALKSATDTRECVIARGALASFGDIFHRQFGERAAVVVSDGDSFAAAGARVIDALCAAGRNCLQPYIFTDPKLYAEHRYVSDLEQSLKQHDAVPIAVGAGTINDLTKLAAYRAGRPYLCVATAASMDGYTAFGASIECKGSKQTFHCPAPRAVVADLDVIAAAPPQLNSAGYADLLAKITAGADWILADALGVEPIDPVAWNMVQARLRDWLARPSDVEGLTQGLMISGLAMQKTQSSRPASGAEHQFSHLWDMQHHTHDGYAPLHGFKVGIGTLAAAELYEQVLKLDLSKLEIERCCAAWSEKSATAAQMRELFESEALVEKAKIETQAKHPSRSELRIHLQRLREIWPALRSRLGQHLLPSATIRQMLKSAGAPSEAQQIGIAPERLLGSFRQAYHIRRRYTVLDLAVRAGILDSCLDAISRASGRVVRCGTQSSR